VTELPPPRPTPGVRPRLYEPDVLWGWVFLQHLIWVNIRGDAVEVEWMDLGYVANVVEFCRVRATRIRAIVNAERICTIAELVFTGDFEGGIQLWDEFESERTLTDLAWLETTPLMRALRRRLDRRQPRHHDPRVSGEADGDGRGSR
jgi:hypothetical protein